MIDLAHPLFADTKVLSEHCQRYGFIAPNWVIDMVDFITQTAKIEKQFLLYGRRSGAHDRL